MPIGVGAGQLAGLSGADALGDGNGDHFGVKATITLEALDRIGELQGGVLQVRGERTHRRQVQAAHV